MQIGVAKEIKPDEYRVALTPAGARELVQRGHEVLVETGAGDGSAFPDADYEAVGARLASVDEVWARPSCCSRSRSRSRPSTRDSVRGSCSSRTSTSPPSEELTRALVASGATCVAYETVETDDRTLPLLAPMSEVAGRLATQMPARTCSRSRTAAAGSCSAASPASRRAGCVVLGGGIVGYNAA